MMNPLSCPYPLFSHGDGAVPRRSRQSEFPKRIWKAAGSRQHCRAPAAFPGCVILVGILGMGHFIAWMRTCSAPAVPVALPDSSPRKEREVLVFQRLQSPGAGVCLWCVIGALLGSGDKSWKRTLGGIGLVGEFAIPWFPTGNSSCMEALQAQMG